MISCKQGNKFSPTCLYTPTISHMVWFCLFLHQQILKQVWPNVGHYVRNIILEAVQPGIRESLKAYKLGGFKMDKISLGTMVYNSENNFLQSTFPLTLVCVAYSPSELAALRFTIRMSRVMKLWWIWTFGKLPHIHHLFVEKKKSHLPFCF